MNAVPKPPLQRRIDHARKCLLFVKQMTADLQAARRMAKDALADLHGEFPIRETAQRSPLAPVTVSNLFRGRLVTSAEHALMVLDSAEAARRERAS